jgi:hypothetical protein
VVFDYTKFSEKCFRSGRAWDGQMRAGYVFVTVWSSSDGRSSVVGGRRRHAQLDMDGKRAVQTDATLCATICFCRVPAATVPDVKHARSPICLVAKMADKETCSVRVAKSEDDAKT